MNMNMKQPKIKTSYMPLPSQFRNTSNKSKGNLVKKRGCGCGKKIK